MVEFMRRQQLPLEPHDVEQVRYFLRVLWKTGIPESHSWFDTILGFEMRRRPAPDMTLDIYWFSKFHLM